MASPADRVRKFIALQATLKTLSRSLNSRLRPTVKQSGFRDLQLSTALANAGGCPRYMLVFRTFPVISFAGFVAFS